MNKFTLMIRQSFPTKEWRALEYIVFFILISIIAGLFYIVFNPAILYKAMDNNIAVSQNLINREPSCVKKLIIKDFKSGNIVTFSNVTAFKVRCNNNTDNSLKQKQKQIEAGQTLMTLFALKQNTTTQLTRRHNKNPSRIMV